MTQPQCHVCGKETNLACSACKEAFYCSQECQAKDWPEHKELHKVRNCLKIPFPRANDDAWDDNAIVKALQENGYFIVKLVNEEDVQKMVDFRTANEALFASSVKAKSALQVPPGVTLEGAKAVYRYHPEGMEYFDLRLNEAMTNVYPDPTPIVSDYNEKFYPAYALVAELVKDLLDSIIKACNSGTALGHTIQEGANHSCVRILNQQPGEWFKPHIDSGSLSVSMRGTSVGLGVYSKSLGGYCYPELAMDRDNELLVIAGMDLDTCYTGGKIKPTKHFVVTKEPRVSSVFNINTGILFMRTFGGMGADESDDEFERMLRPNQPTTLE